jgi:formate dehydrogenase subunit gamma
MSQTPTPAPVSYLARFSLVERAAHWLLAATFAGMLASGVFIGGAGPIGGRAMLTVHVGFATVLVAGVAAMTVLRRHRRRLSATAADLRRIGGMERRWLREGPLRMLRRQPLPPAGRFNGGQKLNSMLLFGMLVALYATGTGALTGRVDALHPLSLLRPLGALHGAVAVAMSAVVVAHIYLGAIHPDTRHALHGMLRGSVRRDWALEHHADWVRQLDAEAVSGRARRAAEAPADRG